MQGQVNTYQGLNFDAGYDSIPNTMYINAKDIRITTSKGESMGSFTNIQGNQEAFIIPQTGATNIAEIIGYTVIRNKIIVFVTDDSDSNGWIYLVMYDEATRQILFGYPQLLYFNANLNFSKKYPIEAFGRYESEKVQRIYWSDYNNFFRSLNIQDPNLSTFPLGQVDIFPDINYTQPLLKVISGGGAVQGGEYQAAYRLITFDGKQSLISPPSNLIHVITNSETLIQSAQYNGDPITPVTTGKALTIEIDTSNYGDYDKIELIMIYHSAILGTPSVTVVDQVSINNASTIEFVYTGTETSAFTIELLDYTTKSYPFKTPKSLTQKDNSLVIANIKGSSVSIQDLLDQGETFDAKTYRYNSSSVINSDVFNQDYNSDAQWDLDWHTNKQFKYQSDGLTLGGEGINIKYKFHLEPLTIDASTTLGFANVGPFPDSAHSLNNGYNYYNSTYPSFASPFISGLLRGYKRGETYRFGIVGFTTKGESTFVEFIGDIKFPDISEKDNSNNASGTKYFPLSDEIIPNITTGYSMGIEFTIDLSSAPSLLSKLDSYQIVRLKRQEVDKRRISQGIIKTFWFAPIASPGSGINFDLRINSNSNVLHLMPYYPNAGEKNATFNTLQDQEDAPSPFTPIYNDYLIKGKYLGFYSPDIAYNKNNVRTLGTTLTNTPSLLITGAYANYNRTPLNIIDLTSENLPDLCIDFRDTAKITYPVSYNSVENIKSWKNNTLISMDDQSSYTSKVTDSFDNYFMRNYYAIDDYADTSADLNDPQGTDGTNTSTPEFFRGGTSIVGKIQKIVNDPITGDPITGSSTDWFNAPTNIKVLNKNTGVANPSVHPNTTPIVDLVIPKAEIYGGYNNDALESNIFTACSPIISISNLNPVVYGGDTFLNMFTLQTAMLDFNPDFYEIGTLGAHKAYAHDNSQTELYVTESTINIDLAYGSIIKTGVEYKLGSFQHTILRQENNNIHTNFGKSLNMYAYNDVYSAQNDDVTFFIKPTSLIDFPINDLRAYLSDVKINGETIDSWTKFGVNNYYDVDDYGPINKILNWKDNVFFIQDRAVGVYAINRAAITTTTDGVPTQLGTGQGFGKHQYISKEHGSIHQWGIKATDTGIYFFDSIHRKIFVLSGANTPISEIKGIHSWLNNLPDGVFLRKENGGDNPILGKGITIGRDIINDEVIFTYFGMGIYPNLQTNTDYFIGDIIHIPNLNIYRVLIHDIVTSSDYAIALNQLINNSTLLDKSSLDSSIVYDELMQQFSSLYSATPSIYLENGDIMITPNSNGSTLYTHNIGNFGEFYGQTKECSIDIVINPNPELNKVLRYLEFNSIIRDLNKTIDRTKTITAYRVQTQYQDTGKIIFSSTPNRLKRRFDKWRIKLSRDLTTSGRLRSSYFIVTLYFDNSENKELIMNKLLSYYDIQSL